MKVMLVSGSLAPMRCGVGDYVGQLATALSRVGHTVAILTSAEANTSIEGASVFTPMSTWTWREAFAAFRRIKGWRPDILHIQYPSRGYRSYVLPSFLPLMAAVLGIRVIRTWHEIPDAKHAAPFLIQSFPPGPYIYVRPEFEQQLAPVFKRALRRSQGNFIAGASAIARAHLTHKTKQSVRERYLEGKERLIVFFGFLYDFKGVEQVFDIANPATDRIVIAGEPGEDAAYVRMLEGIALSPRMADSVRMTGFLDIEDSGRLLAVADAVVLPFRRGGGIWNSSIHAAVVQGTPVVTTSLENRGLDERRMIYYARPDDIEDMRHGLAQLAGRRRPADPEFDSNEWDRVACCHMKIYTDTLAGRDRQTEHRHVVWPRH